MKKVICPKNSEVISDGTVSVVRSDPSRPRPVPVEWDPQARRLVLKPEQTDEHFAYSETAGQWRELKAERKVSVRISVKQSMNDVPEFEAQEWDGHDVRTDCLAPNGVDAT
jgi:hypothetical protein